MVHGYRCQRCCALYDIYLFIFIGIPIPPWFLSWASILFVYFLYIFCLFATFILFVFARKLGSIPKIVGQIRGVLLFHLGKGHLEPQKRLRPLPPASK